MRFLNDRVEAGDATLLLAHGAGAPMDSPFMDAIAAAIAARGIDVARFEFAYMAARRDGGRRPPPRADRLTDEFLKAVACLNHDTPLFIGGKSMGGRVASMIAEDLFRSGAIAGLICLGYPFHPPKRPEALRTAHLETLTTPALICQGTRDPFGTKAQVETYRLSKTITVDWLEDGDHDFKTAKNSPHTQAENIEAAADRITRWVDRIIERA